MWWRLKKEEWGGGGGSKLGVSRTGADRRGSDADSPMCDREGGHVVVWSLRRLPATTGLLGLSFHGGAEDQKIPSALNLTLNTPQSLQKPEGLLRGSVSRRGHLKNGAK